MIQKKCKEKLNIAVVGGGIYGCTIAYKLAKVGYSVSLFEKKFDLLQGASTAQHYKLHIGYHYPRSVETAKSCKKWSKSFIKEFPRAVRKDFRQFYAISRTGSRTSVKQFMRFCKNLNIAYKISKKSFVNNDNVGRVFEVPEYKLDKDQLKAILWMKLNKYGVKINLGVKFSKKDVRNFDQVIIATYAYNNELFSKKNRKYKFQLVEKPIVRLPGIYRDIGVTVLDGKFINFDPIANTPYHILGSPSAGVVESTTSKKPVFKSKIQKYSDVGVIEKPSCTKINKFKKIGRKYFIGFDRLRYIGSMYTVRAVLPNLELTDERPTIVERVDNNIINVFAGKFSGCLFAADQVIRLLNNTKKPSTAFGFNPNGCGGVD